MKRAKLKIEILTVIFCSLIFAFSEKNNSIYADEVLTDMELPTGRLLFEEETEEAADEDYESIEESDIAEQSLLRTADIAADDWNKYGSDYFYDQLSDEEKAYWNALDVHDMVKDLKVIFGKGPGGQPVPNDADGRAPMWKKKSIFWELEYWKVLDVRSAIDVMHVTKNLCVTLLGFLGVYGKTKDTPEAREDLQRLHEKDGMPPKQYEGPASYALTKEEKEIFFECLLSMKVPTGFSSNIKGIINMAEKKFQNLKSHDCHVIMTQLLPVALRGLLPENVRLAIVKLCAFLNAISQKVIDPEIIPRLRSDVAQCLVSFELVFPPSFFNIMTHVLVHLVDEIVILGPVFLHNMFPFERFMGVLKKYVRNRARPEGSISMGHQTEDVIACSSLIRM